MKITIITPTYNRAHTLQNLYSSLKKQTSYNFEWIIIDDGSEDDTKKICEEFIREQLFDVSYIKKNNGGKHTALNLGISKAKGELTFIVDSDDILTKDAIELITYEWSKVNSNELICGISFLRGYTETTVIGDKHPKDYMIDNYINLRINKGIKGDKAEVWVTNKLREFSFPEIEGEKFLGEGYIWCSLAKKYDMLFINKIIYITEYLEGGLTKSGRALRIKSPIGGMVNCKVCFSKEFVLKAQIKSMLLYVVYGFFAKKSIKFMIEDSKKPLLVLTNLPLACCIYIYWKNKYKIYN